MASVSAGHIILTPTQPVGRTKEKSGGEGITEQCKIVSRKER